MDCKHCGAEIAGDSRFCGRCGKGASEPAAKRSNKSIILIILAVVAVGAVAIVGIIAAIAVPNLLNAIDRGKQKRSMADIRSIGTAVEEFAIDNNRYPVAASIDELQSLFAGKYMSKLPEADGWGNPFLLESEETGYTLISTGKNGVVDGCGEGKTGRFDADICFRSGKFTQWPEGMQR